jgi:hypothetical protein
MDATGTKKIFLCHSFGLKFYFLGLITDGYTHIQSEHGDRPQAIPPALERKFLILTVKLLKVKI